MRRLKTIISVLMILMMTSVTAFAGEMKGAINKDTSWEGDVTLIYEEGEAPDVVYSVDVVWGSLEFTYTDESVDDWNPETNGYDIHNEAEWSFNEGDDYIQLTNHSNAQIIAALSFENNTGMEGIEGKFYDSQSEDSGVINQIDLGSAVNTEYDKSPSKKAYVKMSGALPAEYNSSNGICKVKVTLNTPQSNEGI